MLRVRRAMALFAVVAVVAITLPISAKAEQNSPPCKNAAELVKLTHPLSHVGRRLASREPITVVALGSSSTAGAGASSPANSYPSRLEADLKNRFPGHPITVINRGVNGEEVGDMLKRFDDNVVAAKPDLVLWQVGTNSVLRDRDFISHAELIRSGLKKLRALGSDVVIIDPQYAPRVLAKGEGAQAMLVLLAQLAKQEKVSVFHRFAVMKRWHEVDQLAFSAFVDPDGLHHNDWSYACIASGLGQAISEAALRPVISAATTAVPVELDWYQ